MKAKRLSHKAKLGRDPGFATTRATKLAAHHRWKIRPGTCIVKRKFLVHFGRLGPIFSGSVKLTRSNLVAALRQCQGNAKDAALILGVSRQAVYLAVRRFGIRRREPTEAISERMRRAARARWDRRPAA